MTRRIMLLHILGGFLMMTTVVQCCFITDCPRGMGKRSSLPAILKPTTGPKWKYPQCPTCGPIHLQQGPDSFRCFGPSLCCSPTKGCLSGSLPGARACAYEDMSTTPCENHVKHCKSAGEAGQCVYKGICCNPNGICAKDDECKNQNIPTIGSKPNLEKFFFDLENTIRDLMMPQQTRDSLQEEKLIEDI